MVLQRRGRRGDPYATRLDALAGGHIGAGETPTSAALRELEEEVGLLAHPDRFLRLGSGFKDRPVGDCRRIVQHLLLYSTPIELTELRFSSEVDGFVRTGLTDFDDLVNGRCEHIEAQAYLADSDGVAGIRLSREAVDYPDAILDTFRRSLASIQDWMTHGRVDPHHFE